MSTGSLVWFSARLRLFFSLPDTPPRTSSVDESRDMSRLYRLCGKVFFGGAPVSWFLVVIAPTSQTSTAGHAHTPTTPSQARFFSLQWPPLQIHQAMHFLSIPVWCPLLRHHIFNTVPPSSSTLCTSVYGINALHFAAAAVDATLLGAMHQDVHLSTVNPTASSHTLLHIACLPFDDTQFNILSHAMASSNHDVHTLSPPLYSESLNISQLRQSSSPEFCHLEPRTRRPREICYPSPAFDVDLQRPVTVKKKAPNFLLIYWDAARSWTTVENKVGYNAVDLYDLGQSFFPSQTPR
ncbi:hypothetical protein DOTSEDRAFT_80497 [Dothistroma septosporum NZE10]|uniref:Uncharacterized protein n=1 Tax=Dothistroma septosporum (strain NZE10 / CBS 128990) TaxID=675120 RepID=M2XKA8_DOTSN|nr:hypothetical protein DOTSEDRAFT_80497 [Dothistroma septosporum NZE10]